MPRCSRNRSRPVARRSSERRRSPSRQISPTGSAPTTFRQARTRAQVLALAPIADLAEWNALIATQLPQGIGEVRFLTGAPATPSSYTIRVSWIEVGQADAVTYELRLEI